jgi:hypothetical protein
MTPNVWGQGKMDVQLKQRVHLPLLWLFSSVRPSDEMTEWCPPALVCVTFFTQSIKSMLISSFDNQLKLLIRSILPFLWLSLVYQSVSEHIIYYIDDFNCFFPIVVSLHFSLFVRTCLRKLKSVSDNMFHILIGMPPVFHRSEYHWVLISHRCSLMKTFCCCCFWLLMLFFWWVSDC